MVRSGQGNSEINSWHSYSYVSIYVGVLFTNYDQLKFN